MLPALFLAFCIAATAAVMALVWSSLKKDIARVFPEDYKTLKQSHPYTLKTFRFVSGSLRTKNVLPFRFRGKQFQFPNSLRFRATLKLDVYSHMLVVSTMGQALCLRYGEHVFKRERFGPFHVLSVENLPVLEKRDFGPFLNPVDFGRTTTLTIRLVTKRIDCIKELADRCETVWQPHRGSQCHQSP